MVNQAQANLNLAKVTASRYNDLYGTRAVSQQDVDNQNANVKVQEANVSAAQAFVSGIEKTEAFKQVVAPIDGVITARRVDIGDFVTATGQTNTPNTTNAPVQTGTPNQALFRVADTKTLRVYVNVPEFLRLRNGARDQRHARACVQSQHPRQGPAGGAPPTRSIPPRLPCSPKSTSTTPTAKLLPGGYAQVHFDIVTKHPPMVIPGNSMIFRSAGPQVGVVDDSGIVHLRDITIGRDLGMNPRGHQRHRRG